MKSDLRKKGVTMNGVKTSKAVVKEKGTTVIHNHEEKNYFLFMTPEKPNLYNDFATVNLEFFRWLSMQKLTARKCRILHYLFSKMNFDNRVIITNKEIQEELKIYKTNLSNDLKDLIEKGILLRSKVGIKSYEVRLNLDSIYINQQAIYKGKRSSQNIKSHKELIERNSPYYLQPDLFGGASIVDKKTGEMIKGVRECNHTYLNDAEAGDNKMIEVTKQIENTDDEKDEKIKELQEKVNNLSAQLKRKETETK